MTSISTRRRVVLVEPAGVEANVFATRSFLPLLGPLYLGTILKEAGFDVTVVSENILGRRLGPADLDADFLLLSCLTSTVERGYELAALFKRLNRAGRVIMGGPHVTFMQEEALRYADHVVAGEGESVIVDLLRHGTQEPVIQGSPVEDLDTLPFIDWSLLAGRERMKVQPVMGSRGCPFGCNFCSVTAMFGRGYRAMSVPRLLEECARVTLPEVFFYDDNFAANRKRTHEIADGMLRLGSRRFSWGAQVRADLTRDPELCGKMVRAGMSCAYVGFESINDRALAEMHKSQTAEDVRKAIRVFHQTGIKVHGMFIFGADADDPAVVRATSDFVRAERIDSVQYMLLTPLPGTELFERLHAEGRLLHEAWRYYDGMHVVFQPQGFSPHELQDLTVDTYTDFYSVLRALNEGIETAAASLMQVVGGAPSWLRGLPSLRNAVLKVVGKRIIRRWCELNAGYLEYLRGLSWAKR